MNVASFQGGGCLGFGQVLFLLQFEKRTGLPAYKVFDLMAGTSVGSIVAGAESVGIPASQVLPFFQVQAPLIFKKDVLSPLEALTGPRYSAAQLESGLQTLFTITDASGPRQATLADCKTKLIVPSLDVVTGKPIYFKSYESSSETEDEIVIGPDSGVELWQVCRASAAAQTYFPAYQLGTRICIDGGNESDNAPDVLALLEAEQWSERKYIRMLSLGTGSSPWNVDAKAMINPSPIRAGIETISILFAAGVSSAVSKARRALAPRYWRVSPDLGTGVAIDDASEAALNKMSVAWDQVILANAATFTAFTGRPMDRPYALGHSDPPDWESTKSV